MTATIIDLAVRGFLKIIEIPKEGLFGKQDWNLQVVLPAPTAELLPYEMALMQAIFKGRNEVLLSDLKNTFASDLKATQTRLYDDVTARGWFRGNPQTVRGQWGWAGLAAIVAGVAVTWFGSAGRARTSSIPGFGLVLGGLVARWMAKRMPARTAAGLGGAGSGQRFPALPGDGRGRPDQVRGGPGHLQPLPALRDRLRRGRALGQGLRPARRVRRQRADPDWYTGYYVGNAFNFGGFGSAMDSFSTVAAGRWCRRRPRPACERVLAAAEASPVVAAEAVAAAPGEPAACVSTR